jgi:alpha-amylase/alpha-mannosidase (GH57 family)
MPVQAFCIHAHFYQPPREDPLTGIIPVEPSAAPYPNWNERIYTECYRPNAELRNFEQISFNIGPTLFDWMNGAHPQTCAQIVEQDQANVQRFGIGNALAQAYNHTILPLDSYRTKLTQIYWGKADFEHRFGRKPQGMWLPETAVDYETLEALAFHDIKFTILAPWQAVDPLDPVDPSEPYTVGLPNHKQVVVFFYQAELSGRISFDPLATVNADTFIQDILIRHFAPEKKLRDEPQLLLIASDGELYGHHQQLRDRFLAHLVNSASRQAGLQPTYLSLWLKDHPPRRSIRIRERTSWSCHHGVTRWMGQCGCTPGDATWKVNLRLAFDHLAAAIDQAYLDVTSKLISDPWLLRDRYIHVLLGEISLDALLRDMAGHALTSEQTSRVHWILEAQRERQRMFTSCGWFFEDFDRIEPHNNVAYAAQAIRLVRMASGTDLEPAALQELQKVISQRSGENAADVFKVRLRRAEGLTAVRTI